MWPTKYLGLQKAPGHILSCINNYLPCWFGIAKKLVLFYERGGRLWDDLVTQTLHSLLCELLWGISLKGTINMLVVPILPRLLVSTPLLFYCSLLIYVLLVSTPCNAKIERYLNFPIHFISTFVNKVKQKVGTIDRCFRIDKGMLRCPTSSPQKWNALQKGTSNRLVGKTLKVW